MRHVVFFTGAGVSAESGIPTFRDALAGLWERFDAATSCDALYSIGTSSLVQPAAQIPVIAKRHGARVVQVNPHSTPLDAIADLNVRAPAAVALPGLLA